MPAPTTLVGRLREVLVRVGPLGFVAFGGPGVHIVLFRRLFVLSSDPWLDATTFADLFSLSGALPGPGSTQLLFSIALVRGGALAGILAFLLFSLPGAVGMFLLSLGVKQIPTVLPSLALALLTGLNASAVGLIFYAGYQLAKMTSTDALTRLILFASASIASCYSAIWLFPVLTVAGGLVTLVGDWKGWGRAKMAIQEKRRKRKGETGSDAEDDGDARSARQDDAIALEELNHGGIEEPVITPLTRVATSHSGSNSKPTSLRIPTPPPSPTGLRRRNVPVPVTTSVVEVAATPERTPINFHLSIAQSSAIVACFFTILIAILVLNGTLSAPTRALQLFSNLLTAGSILFGGGPVVVPLLQGYTVDPGWVSTQDFLFGFAILQAFPGPNFNFAVFLGALSLPGNPVLGGVLGYIGIFTPGIMLKFAMLPTYSKFREHPTVRSTLRGLNSAASGLVWTAVFRLWKVGLLTGTGTASLEKSGYWATIAGAAFVASESFGIPPPASILGGALAGLIYGGVIGAP